MTLGDLIERLQDLAEEHGEDLEVRLAHQPNWPLEYSIGEVTTTEAVRDGDLDEDGEAAQPEDAQPAIVYIGEGQQLGYLSGDASRALGWKE